ncbi:MFS transporter [Gallaecimonas mangrovi]|uniref:MFS transporter n=1 Tax=Gallaecimonas mangrovi TaxID=2291597 RepID=UPI000E1FCD2C|nr:MFS transporter [Gallaecimonas mangrovi]
MASSHPKAKHESLAELALAIGGLAIGTGEFAAMSLLPEMAHGTHVDIPTAGHFISSYALGVVVGAPLFAILGTRVPRRLMLLILMVLFAAGNFLSVAVSSYWPLMVARFISGLPHGAYFGVAALVAAALVDHDKRATAVGRVMLGLSVANVIGVPLATWMGQALGWRSLFISVGGLAILTVILVRSFVPKVPTDEDASIKNELTAFTNLQLWLTLLAAAIGFGGMFAVYSYISPLLTHVTGVSEAAIPWILTVFGIGNIAGTVIGGKAADKAIRTTILVSFLVSGTAAGLFVFGAHALWSALVLLFFVGCTQALAPSIQTHLMDIGKKAQTLAAALNQSAFNVANANGAWLGGLAISANLGWTSPGWVGALLAFGGFVVMGLSFLLEKRRAN